MPPTICPHCDSPRTEAMKERSYEVFSTNTWYQCRDCKRMWSVAKHSDLHMVPDDEFSPKS